MDSKKYRALRYNNETYPGYWVCEEGYLYTSKESWRNPLREMRKLNERLGGNSPYPKTNISVNGINKTLLVHIAVCDTWNHTSMPIPDGVSKADWKQTPKSVKAAMRFMYQVNHIDHDHCNHHPSNLEYVTSRQNQQKYQEHRLQLAS
jgi:hypothetical protein